MFLVTLANQTLQSANQHRVLMTSPDAPAQANTAFMVNVFLGGSVGAVVLTGLACLAWALSLHQERRRGELVAGDRPAGQRRVTV